MSFRQQLVSNILILISGAAGCICIAQITPLPSVIWAIAAIFSFILCGYAMGHSWARTFPANNGKQSR